MRIIVLFFISDPSDSSNKLRLSPHTFQSMPALGKHPIVLRFNPIPILTDEKWGVTKHTRLNSMILLNKIFDLERPHFSIKLNCCCHSSKTHLKQCLALNLCHSKLWDHKIGSGLISKYKLLSEDFVLSRN